MTHRRGLVRFTASVRCRGRPTHPITQVPADAYVPLLPQQLRLGVLQVECAFTGVTGMAARPASSLTCDEVKHGLTSGGSTLTPCKRNEGGICGVNTLNNSTL